MTFIVKYSHEMMPEKEEAYQQHDFIRKIPVMSDHRKGKNRDGILSLAQGAGGIPGRENRGQEQCKV